jgi:hypothetical protein
VPVAAARPAGTRGRFASGGARTTTTHDLDHDLDGKNGTRLDGVRRPTVLLEPGPDLAVRVTLIA